ncbi:MAG: SxtJ family membrane protein [Burkholderiales bacterium]
MPLDRLPGPGSLLACAMPEYPVEPDPDAERAAARSLSVTFCVACVAAGVWPAFTSGPPRLWLIAAGIACAGLALIPVAAIPILRLWTKLGRLIGRLVAPIAMAAVFFLVVTPTALVMRLLGKDPLRLRPGAGERSYWIARTPPAAAPGDFLRQF